MFCARCGTTCIDSWYLPSSLLFILTRVPTHKKYRILCYALRSNTCSGWLPIRCAYFILLHYNGILSLFHGDHLENHQKWRVGPKISSVNTWFLIRRSNEQYHTTPGSSLGGAWWPLKAHILTVLSVLFINKTVAQCFFNYRWKFCWIWRKIIKIIECQWIEPNGNLYSNANQSLSSSI